VNRGDVFELRLTRGARGHEQRGRRFGVVVQSGDLSPLSTAIVAPTSTAAAPASFRPEVKLAGASTRVLCDQMRALEARRLGKRAGRLKLDELDDVDAGLRIVLDL